MVSTEVCIPGYKISEELYNGSRTLVYRGYRERDSLPIVIKLLKNAYPSFNELVQFRNQYTIAKNLNYPGIIQTYSLESYHNGYVLVMEDFGGISLKDYFKNLETLNNTSFLTEFLEIAISLCDILNILYQQQVIHKDIKPANILINPETKQVKLIDFSIASLLKKETEEIKSPNVLEGTLAYLSPEQTGRMNRGIDYRSDFYSLGVTFYELLSGKLPFISNDAMELVHCHIAKKPLSVNSYQLTVNSEEIPSVLNDIVMKLMAKNAEDRYQSALGLKYDLENCLCQIKETGKVSNFQIAQRDICDRFIIPDKLYGREKEVEQLLAAFDRVSGGNSEMILVAGFSGIGKTAVVKEVHKPIVKQRGYFIKGKFDQFNRNIPLDAFVQAFRDLIGQLLSESNAQLSNWKDKILQAVGEQGQVIIDVIPELEKIIGKQPSLPELSGTNAQNRFNLLFQKFIQVFTSKSHPLVIFLDDLQWADSASLKLIKLLVNGSAMDYLLIIGAYRDNEVFPAHSLMLTLDEINKNAGQIQYITLKPLSYIKINKLVADTFKSSEDIVFDLAKLVYHKTEGNPFFCTQFLKYLYEDKLIEFNWEEQCWQCDMTQINQKSLTSDVLEFMIFQLQRLPESTQYVLKLAACIGNKFDLETLSIISNDCQFETASYLWNALKEGYILPQTKLYKFFVFVSSENKNIDLQTNEVVKYKFLHDRVQQATYSLIPETETQITHLKIGYRLWHNLPESQIENHLFNIVNHLNIGCDLIPNQIERNRIAKLNFQASQKAKISVAYESYLRYCYAGQKFLHSNSWEDNYSLQFSLALATIEAEYLNHNLQVAQELSEQTLEKAKTLLDCIKVHELQILFAINQNQMQKAVNLAIDVLILLDIKIPKEPHEIKLETELLLKEITLPTEKIANLETLKTIEDENKLAAIRILTNASSAAYIANPTIFPLIIVHTVRYCIKYGNSPLAASAYSWYGALLCGVFNNIEVGYEFGKLSLQILDKFNARNLTAKVSNMFNVFIRPWKEHLNNSLTALPEAISSGFENGDVEYAFYAAVHYSNYLFYSGIPLEEVHKVQECYLPEIIKAKYEFHEGFLRINQQVVNNLIGENETPQYLNGSLLDGESCLSQWLENNIVFLIFCFYEAQTRLAYLFEDNTLALEAGEKGLQYRQAALGTLYVSEHNFYYSLALLKNGKLKSQEHIAENQKQLKIWADFSPTNFQHKYDLIEAEKYRILGKNYQAGDYYDKAIAGAKENKFISEEALGNELAAKFYLNWGKEKIAAAYMQEAYYCYAKWGAKAKTDDLEKRYPDLLHPILQTANQILKPLETMTFANYSIHHSTSNRSSSSTNVNQTLDFTTVIKASQTISRTIDLDELMKTLTRMMLENSGADKCALLLSEDEILQVRAIANFDNVNLQITPLEDNSSVPRKLIQYVKRTQESIVIDKLQTNLAIIGDYLNQHQPQSILCLPILNQGQFIGILYLENQTTSCVFTSDRMFVLNFLCTQAAISLENARLYSQQQQKNSEIAEKEAEYRSIFESVNDGLAICDLETGKVIASNPTYCRIHGYTQTEFSYLTPADYIHSDYIHLFGEYVTSLKAGKEFYTQCVDKRKDGSYFDVEVKAVPFIYKGKLHGLTIVRDISKQQTAQREIIAAKKALEESNTLLNLLLQTIPDVFFAKDLQGRYITINANAAKLVGKSIGEIIGQTDNELFPPEFAESIIAKDQEIITKGITESLEEVIPINEVIRTYFSVKTPLRDSQGNISGLIGLTRDITDRKQAEEAVIQKSQELEEALQELQQAQLQIVQSEKMSALGNLVASVAHEMNNPLGFISTTLKQVKPAFADIVEHLKLYQENFPNPDEEILENAEEIDLEYTLEDFPKMINSMVMACDRLKNISTSLRTFSRADKEYKVDFNIHQGIDSTILILKHRLKANEKRPAIEVITDYAKLPQIECFPGQLNQVLMNILANAIDALEESNHRRNFEEIKANPNQITVQTLMGNNSVKIIIADNGKGMSEETKSKIFEHLFTTKGVGKGTGLGLAIAKQIIEEKHGGKLSCNSILGEGTEFIIEIPV